MNGKPLTSETDFTPLGMSAEQSFSGPVAFVGYSIGNPEKNYDDFAGIDVKGKVVLALRFEPTDEKAKSTIHRRRLQRPRRRFPPRPKPPPIMARSRCWSSIPRRPGSADVRLRDCWRQIPHPHHSYLPRPSRRACFRLRELSRVAPNDSDLKSLKSQINTTFKPHSFDVPNVTISGTVEIDPATNELSQRRRLSPRQRPA